MATTTSIFLESNLPLEATIDRINSTLGIRLKARENSDCYECKTLAVSLSAFEGHGLEDDMGIDFSSYKYELDIEVDRQGVDHEVADLVQQSMTLLLHSKFKTHLNWSCVAVANLQRVMAE